MDYPRPPRVSRKTIVRAGDILINRDSSSEKLLFAREILNRWRAAHAYPINTFQSTLRAKTRYGQFGKDAVIAQRLKRASTIISKLSELKPFNIGLLNMQDIAGVRAILPSIKDVRSLEEEFRANKRFPHELKRSRDYIQEPKEKDGYRSIHLIYKYKNKMHREWNGLLVEVQIRTRLQHSWATAVETIHTFMGKAVKTRQGQKSDEKWTEFFCLVASAFAIIEGTPVVNGHTHMTQEEILSSIRKHEKELKVMEKLRAFPVALRTMWNKARKSHFHLIVLDTAKKTINVASFGREESKKANLVYERIEKRNANNETVEPVLVSTTEGSLRSAYSSFFADTKDFAEHLGYILSGRWVKNP